MATLTPVSLTNSPSLTLAAATAGGDTVSVGNIGIGRCFLIVRNASGSSVNVTVADQKGCDDGFTHNLIKACPAGQDTEINLTPSSKPTKYLDTNGNAAVTYSATTSITVAAVVN